MKNYPFTCFLLIFTLFAGCLYGQAWQQYTDSAKLYLEQNKTGKAIEWYGKANIELKKDSADTQTYAALCNQLAGLYTKAAQYLHAEPLYLEAKQVQLKLLGNKHLSYAASCNSLANLYWYMDQYEKAEQLYLEAKQIKEDQLGKQHPDYASSCNNLAALYWKTGRYEQAELLYLQAREIQANVLGTAHPDYARSCNNLALLYYNTGLYDKAEPLYLEAKKIREKYWGKEHPAYAASCNDLANLYLKTNRYAAAGLLYLEAKQIQEKQLGKQHPDYAGSCNNLANLYLHMEQYIRAEPLYLEAKQIQASVYGKLQPDYAGSCYNLAMLYRLMGRYKQAEPLYLEAKRLQARVLGRQHPDYGATCDDLANLYRLMHRPLPAEKEFEESFSVNYHNLFAVFPFLNEKEKAAYIKNVLGDDEKAYSFYVSEKIKSGLPYALSLFHRNLILSSAQALKKQLAATLDTTLVCKYRAWTNTKKYLSVLYSQPVNDRKKDAAEMEAKAGRLEQELMRLSAAFAKQQQPADWKKIRNKLHDDEAAVEFASFHFNNGRQATDTILYVALLLRKYSVLPSTVLLCSEKQLTGLLLTGNVKTNAGVQQLYTPDHRFANGRKGNGTSLYKLIWQPLEKELQGISTIYFAPSGLLHRIAFAALPAGRKEMLSDRYILVQLATTASLVNRQQTYITTQDKLLLYGGISYDADTIALKNMALPFHAGNDVNRFIPNGAAQSGAWDELPGTKEEIAGIVSLSGKNLANITTLSGLNATEESLKSLDGGGPAVLHIATHGFFFPDANVEAKNKNGVDNASAFKLSEDPLMRSGLLFAGANHAWQNKPVQGIEDGILTAYEVSNLFLPSTKLVVLSACETGLGDIKGNEGVYGLQRAFKTAGAQNIIMSLWKVTDLETAEFMKALYQHLFAQKSITDAFYQAQSWMKNKYREQPYKWAAWVLVQ